MNQCKECGKGYCPNRVRRVFGFVQSGFCSPQCFTASVMGEGKGTPDKNRKSLAVEIVDALTVEDFIDAEAMGDVEKFAAAVAIVTRYLP
jgi:hypothetical protein